MNKPKKLLLFGFIAFSFLIIFGKHLGFFSVVALLVLSLGIYKIRKGEDVRQGYILVAIGSGLILLKNFMLVAAIIMISLGFYFAKVRKVQADRNYTQKQSITTNIQWDRDPWVLRNTSMWHIVGELDIDLSLAIEEEHSHIVIFQGIVGDVDLTIPMDYGVDIEVFVLFGKLNFRDEKTTGMMNRLYWKSPQYEQNEYKVKIVISYLVGDVDIKFI
ncbi:cell wall-active antibiotics response protein LiaF [Paenibacillus turicensis]|uniref:cell wall-active antibiotics response protein LiaF n=1 Tax=Paenibacillus turicensis TaxID=160487 RepID=UPI003D270AE9